MCSSKAPGMQLELLSVTVLELLGGIFFFIQKGLTPLGVSAVFPIAPFCIHNFSAARSLQQTTWSDLGVPRLEKL